MLLTPNRFLDLMGFLLLPVCWIPQFTAHFWLICQFLCSAPFLFLVAQKWEFQQSSRKTRKGGWVKILSILKQNCMQNQLNPESQWKWGFRASGNKIGSYFYWKISYFCWNNFCLCQRMAEIRHLSFLCKILNSIGRLCTQSKTTCRVQDFNWTRQKKQTVKFCHLGPCGFQLRRFIYKLYFIDIPAFNCD